jgi:hypothetical protein
MIGKPQVINGFLHQDPVNSQLMGVVRLDKLVETKFISANAITVNNIPAEELVTANGSPFMPQYPSAQVESVENDIAIRIQIRLKPRASQYDFVQVQFWLSAAGEDPESIELNLMVLRPQWNPDFGTYLEVF